MHVAILTCIHHMELLPQLNLQVCTLNEKPICEHPWPNFCTFFTDAMQTLHYKEDTLAHACIHTPSSGSGVANFA